MTESPSLQTPKFCYQCGQPLRPGARFCSHCGIRIEPRPIPAAETQSEEKPAEPAPPPAVTPKPAFEQPAGPPPGSATPGDAEVISSPAAVPAPEPPPPPPQPAPQFPEGCQITLQAVPPAARQKVAQAMVQALGLRLQDAHAYIAAAPVLLGVGLAEETAEALRSILTAAGAVVEVKIPPKPAAPDIPPESLPEPVRRIAVEAQTVQVVLHSTGLRTVSGLDLGRTNSYLSYARAEGNRLVAPPEMVRLEAQPAVPTVVCTANADGKTTIGSEALNDWVTRPETVWAGFWEAVVNGESAAQTIALTFLGQFASRITQVIGESALSSGEGAAATLGYPGAWDEERGRLLMETVRKAGFPVVRIAPEPLAVLAHHLQQGGVKQGKRIERSLVIDWGGSALRLSFIEHGGDLPKPRMFEHIELPLGGNWFDETLMNRLAEQLPPDLSEIDLRALALFARSFKEQLSKSFAEGKRTHAQYCVIPAEMPPTRVQISLADFEALTASARETVQEELLKAVAGVGLKPEHLNHILVAGGGGRWYFLRELIRSTLGKVPLIGSRPEESVCRGLAVYRLEFEPAA